MLKRTFVLATSVGAVFVSLSCQGGGTPPARDVPPRPPSSAAINPIPGLVRQLERDPNDIDSLVKLGHLRLMANQYDQARELTSRALAINPEHPEALTHSAVLLQLQGDEDLAGAMFDRIVLEYPALAEAWYQRGMLAVKSRRHDVARECFDRYVALAPKGEFAQQVSYYLSIQRQRLQTGTDQPSSPASNDDQTAR